MFATFAVDSCLNGQAADYPYRDHFHTSCPGQPPDAQALLQAFIGAPPAWAQALMRAMGRRVPGGVLPSGTAALLAAVSLLIAPLLIPAAWNQWTRDAGSFSVTLLQGGIAQDEKFEQASGVPQALKWYEAQLLGANSDLVVAPETAIPLLPQDLPFPW